MTTIIADRNTECFKYADRFEEENVQGLIPHVSGS